MKIRKTVVSIFTVICILCAVAFVGCEDSGGNNGAEKVFYTVTFHYNMGFETDYTSASVESGRTAADKVPDMYSLGYVFDGWCTDEQLTQDFDIENTPITSDIALYARWKKEKDRTWFLTVLGEREENAAADGIARTTVSYKAAVDGESGQNCTSDVVDGGITVGSYDVRLIITVEWLESEILYGDGITVTSEVYSLNASDGLSATIRFVNAQNQLHIYSFTVDKYGYVTGCSERIDNGADAEKTTLYLISSVQYA
ncbi:MAG: InlB B-repeat-containing protein [Candidatus Coproplasma sp.]